MRTTVTLDSDVLAMLRETMRREGLSFKESLNRAVRFGAAGPTRTRRPAAFVQKTWNLGAPKTDITKALALADRLTDEASRD